ncbi:hypothetical protein GCL60_05800 [Silvanigrella paludirubra]|uniref:Uncharacterized protein n=1 Tax=Silvanigrella paludirubra TaxID=2499159 RepID=A0A6N6VY90_9BACT|nr:hypothetical protein [Silvanigrella paludirubra]KAB8039776.1 hypothetical protein GCL60_05800 [Silvanigrella paludirubra]
MTMKSSLKLTAVSVGIATLAFTACNKKSDDNKPTANESSKKDESKPQPIKNLTVKFNGEIPEGSCSTYTITYTDENGKEADFTQHAKKAGNLSVNLDTATANSKKFELNDETNEVCANAENVFADGTKNDNNGNTIPKGTLLKAKAVKGDPAFITVRSEGFFKSAKTTVSDMAVLKTFTFKGNKAKAEDTSYPNIVSLNAPRGSESLEFFIDAEYSNGAITPISKIEDVIVKTQNDKKLELTSEVKDKITFIKFKVPKDLKLENGQNFTVTVGKITKVLSVNVINGVLEDVKFKNKQSELALDTLNINTNYSANILVKFTDTDYIDITKQKSENDNYKIKITEEDDTNNALTVNTVIDSSSAFVNAYDNPLTLVTAQALTAYKPIKLKIAIQKYNKNGELTLNDSNTKAIFVGTAPKLSTIEFTKNGNKVDLANLIVPGLTQGLIKNCASLSKVSYKLKEDGAEADATVSDFKISIPSSKFLSIEELSGKDYICATKNAEPNKTYDVIVSLKDHDNKVLSKAYTFTAGNIVDTKNYIISNNGNTAIKDDIVLLKNTAGDAVSAPISAYILKSNDSLNVNPLSLDDNTLRDTLQISAPFVVEKLANKTQYVIKLPKAVIENVSNKDKEFSGILKIAQLSGYTLNADKRDNIVVTFKK